MSIVDGVAGFLGLARASVEQKAQIREEINLMDAINAHVKWKVRLEDCLSGKSQEVLDPMVVCRDDQCVLGKWIHGAAVQHFHGDPTFHQLRSDHAEFHFIAGNVIRHVQANERDAAEALLNNDYKHASRRVVQALSELNKHVNE